MQIHPARPDLRTIAARPGWWVRASSTKAAAIALETERPSNHSAIMALQAATAHFEARQVKRGEGWYVLVTWPNGRSAMIHDLASKADAEEWIKNESAAWLKARLTGSHD